MKRFIVAMVVLAILITAGVLENLHVKKTFNEFDAKLAEINILVKDDDASAALEKTKALASWWQKEKDELECFAYSPDLRVISSNLGEIVGSLECEDTKNAMSKVESLKIISKNTRSILDFNLRDII